MGPTPRRFESRVKCLASSSATFAQSRKYSTGRRSPLTSKSAKRAMISHARSMAYCSMLASASTCQLSNHTRPFHVRSMRIRDRSVAPLPLACQLIFLLGIILAIPFRRLVRCDHIHLSGRFIDQSLFFPYTLNLPFSRSNRLQLPTPHSRDRFLRQQAFELWIRCSEYQMGETQEGGWKIFG